MLKPYTYFLYSFLLVANVVFGQQKDTVKINLKHSNILIVNERGEINEWDFEKELNEKKEEKKRESASLYKIGLSLFSNNPEPWMTKYNYRIPYEIVKSNNFGYTSYKKLFNFLNDHGMIYTGIGLQSYNISLGKNIVNNN